ncbi:MAG: chromate transporter [Clostridia bacterium]|nr:chromate transporter [Clostridia bacterium]
MIFLELFWTFFKIGAFTFGGGYAMLPLIQEAVLTKGWAEPEALINFIAVSESTPGPFAINMATYIGAEVGGVFGSVCATLGVVMPSFIVILLVARFFEKFKESRIVKGCMSGLKPAVVGLIGAALLSVAVTVFIPEGFTLSIFTDPQTYLSLAIFGVSAFLAFRKIHPIAIICLSAALGILGGYVL